MAADAVAAAMGSPALIARARRCYLADGGKGRELYLPKAWTEDPDRCREAGVPVSSSGEVEFATKPEPAMRMLTRALGAGVPGGWVTADEVYGQHSRLRRMLEERGIPYVLAVPVNQRVIAVVEGKVAELRADALARQLPAQAWKKISAGAGSKGPRLYHWARAVIRPLEDTTSYWLLVRRSLTDPTDLAYYLFHGPEATPLRELVRVSGTRWAIEETFQTAKGQVGLDQYQVRRYDSWYRHITLAMLAHAFLTVTASHASQTASGDDGKRGLPERSRS
jgi:SRSO17 transposase